ncbi:MAG: hypothetical protein F4Y56_01645 [Acidimicrobiaceae bacterium]|nr:hypothetical protein [Acidimicrobiaceae bacterium]MYF32317.1 hypothetical protein [Acidimicrobiaceae bacterium]MYG77523.1 hypothetical protein [Acidimicrobiaceae bacterium]
MLRLRSSEATTLLGEPAIEPVAYLLVGLPFIFFVIFSAEVLPVPVEQAVLTILEFNRSCAWGCKTLLISV